MVGRGSRRAPPPLAGETRLFDGNTVAPLLPDGPADLGAITNLTKRTVTTLAVAFGAFGLSLLSMNPAEAVPSFARQTGLACETCHTVFPELTPFGRLFKMNGFTISNIKQVTATTPQQSPTLALSEISPVAVTKLH